MAADGRDRAHHPHTPPAGVAHSLVPELDHPTLLERLERRQPQPHPGAAGGALPADHAVVSHLQRDRVAVV